MNLVGNTSDTVSVPKNEWRTVARSVGNAGAGIIRAVRHVLSLSEAGFAALLYQTPSVFFNNLSHEIADEKNDKLCSAGQNSQPKMKHLSAIDTDHGIAPFVGLRAFIHKSNWSGKTLSGN
ncbi:hypothetical protein [Desulfonema magnum]|uniref:Uncharacterized protein n=1 Tax=Desulfonema magnum TaxID=45655 RepID=A0A975BJE3_9BACT|nr:hypothetical protein [Desulfonema magnum]QTA86185.1 Uncharacterized protein dnm_022060 [Desulfonema magnum]